jgi:hypothetical protein
VSAQERTWLSVGAELVQRLEQEAVEREVETMEWQELPAGGSLTVGFMPGEAIKAAIAELELPRVSAIAISSFERPDFYPGFYGIEANYANGRARVYVLDTGTMLTPLLSDFWPAEEVPT